MFVHAQRLSRCRDHGCPATAPAVASAHVRCALKHTKRNDFQQRYQGSRDPTLYVPCGREQMWVRVLGLRVPVRSRAVLVLRNSFIHSFDRTNWTKTALSSQHDTSTNNKTTVVRLSLPESVLHSCTTRRCQSCMLYIYVSECHEGRLSLIAQPPPPPGQRDRSSGLAVRGEHFP